MNNEILLFTIYSKLNPTLFIYKHGEGKIKIIKILITKEMCPWMSPGDPMGFTEHNFNTTVL